MRPTAARTAVEMRKGMGHYEMHNAQCSMLKAQCSNDDAFAGQFGGSRVRPGVRISRSRRRFIAVCRGANTERDVETSSNASAPTVRQCAADGGMQRASQC